jgi:hypothetical protein
MVTAVETTNSRRLVFPNINPGQIGKFAKTRLSAGKAQRVRPRSSQRPRRVTSRYHNDRGRRHGRNENEKALVRGSANLGFV